MDLVAHLKHIEKTIIETTLVAYNGNVAKTAEYLQLKDTTLRAKLVTLNIIVPPTIGYNCAKVDRYPTPRHKCTGLNALKNEAILNALKLCDYNRKKAAAALNISTRTVTDFIHDAELMGMVIPNNIRDYSKKRENKKMVSNQTPIP